MAKTGVQACHREGMQERDEEVEEMGVKMDDEQERERGGVETWAESQ